MLEMFTRHASFFWNEKIKARAFAGLPPRRRPFRARLTGERGGGVTRREA